MKKFVYQARNNKGKKIVGTVEARNEKQAVKLLQEKQLFITSVKLKKESAKTILKDWKNKFVS